MRPQIQEPKRRSDSDIEVCLVTPPDGDHTEPRRCLFSIRALTAETSEVTGAIVCVAAVTESARLRDSDDRAE